MAEEQVPGPSGGPSGDGPWLTVAAAARQMGINPRAIRGRIRRGTIEWKAQGNGGKLVRVPSGDVSPDNPGDGSEDELDQLREERTEAPIAAARADERATALRELCDRLTAELAEARKPWWRRWRG